MEVERAIVDLYRTFLMKDHLGERFEGTVTAVVGSGVFVQLDAPFVDVLVRLEDLGMDRYEVDDDALRVVASRSGDVIALGDRLVVEITDAAILRRTTYGRRVGGEGDGARKGGKRFDRQAPKPDRKKRADERKVARAGRREKKITSSRKGNKKGRKR